jgi:hypothetical protein
MDFAFLGGPKNKLGLVAAGILPMAVNLRNWEFGFQI